MASQQIVSTLNLMGQIIKAQDLLEEAQRKTAQIIKTTPTLYPLAGDVQIDIETALEATQDAETAAHKLFNNLQGSRS